MSSAASRLIYHLTIGSPKNPPKATPANAAPILLQTKHSGHAKVAI